MRPAHRVGRPREGGALASAKSAQGCRGLGHLPHRRGRPPVRSSPRGGGPMHATWSRGRGRHRGRQTGQCGPATSWLPRTIGAGRTRRRSASHQAAKNGIRRLLKKSTKQEMGKQPSPKHSNLAERDHHGVGAQGERTEEGWRRTTEGAGSTACQQASTLRSGSWATEAGSRAAAVGKSSQGWHSASSRAEALGAAGSQAICDGHGNHGAVSIRRLQPSRRGL